MTLPLLPRRGRVRYRSQQFVCTWFCVPPCHILTEDTELTHMTKKLTRRELLATAAAVPGMASVGGWMASNETTARAADAPALTASFSFPLLGDLHFDRLAHHDMEWLAKEHPGDVHQVQNYSRITAEVQPPL